MKYGIVVDGAVGVSGYGKYVADGLNAMDKRYLRIAMPRNLFPEEDKNVKTMSCHSATQMGPVSFAAECRHLMLISPVTVPPINLTKQY
eukprot:11135765-Ditylum_brightwellii.AAC.1